MENESTILNLTRITKDDVMNNRLTKTDMVSVFSFISLTIRYLKDTSRN